MAVIDPDARKIREAGAKYHTSGAARYPCHILPARLGQEIDQIALAIGNFQSRQPKRIGMDMEREKWTPIIGQWEK